MVELSSSVTWISWPSKQRLTTAPCVGQSRRWFTWITGCHGGVMKGFVVPGWKRVYSSLRRNCSFWHFVCSHFSGPEVFVASSSDLIMFFWQLINSILLAENSKIYVRINLITSVHVIPPTASVLCCFATPPVQSARQQQQHCCVRWSQPALWCQESEAEWCVCPVSLLQFARWLSVFILKPTLCVSFKWSLNSSIRHNIFSRFQS